MADNAKLLHEQEAAAFLAVAPSTLATWRCTKRYDLPFVKVGRAVRYRVDDLEAFVERRMVGDGAAEGVAP